MFVVMIFCFNRPWAFKKRRATGKGGKFAWAEFLGG